MYVAELSPPQYRRLVLCFRIAIGVGIVISTIVGATELVDWRVSLGSVAALAAAPQRRTGQAHRQWPGRLQYHLGGFSGAGHHPA